MLYGREYLALQGLWIDWNGVADDAFSELLLKDLGGNAFHAGVALLMLTVALVGLAHIRRERMEAEFLSAFSKRRRTAPT